MRNQTRLLIGADDLKRIISRMAHEIVEKTSDPDALVLVGIRSRGAHLARRLARRIAEIRGSAPAVGVVDVTRFRDDARARGTASQPATPEVPVAVDNKTVVLVDDVAFRGRTARAAMEAVAEFGRPERLLLAVLIDRGARELPIRADVVGRNVEVEESRRVNVMLEECDGIDEVVLADWPARR